MPDLIFTAGETEAEFVSLGPRGAVEISKPQGKKLRSSLGFSTRLLPRSHWQHNSWGEEEKINLELP